MADKTVTVTGCLKAWQPSMDAAANQRSGEAAVSGAAPANHFALTDVEGAGEGAAHARSYALTADASVKLDGHLNHKVELTGKVTPKKGHPTPPASGTPTSMPPPSSPPGKPADIGPLMPRLHVESLKMVSAACP
jgi:hypothetical protein